MTRVQPSLFTYTIGILLLITSCNKKDPTPATITTSTTTTGTTTNANEGVNTWIYEQMKDVYYWADYMPEKAKTNLALDPATDGTGYFYSLLYQYGTIDRNSWIEKASDLSNTLSGINTTFGHRGSLFYLDATKTTVGLFISYVIKGSPMEKAGLQRGDIILSINGTPITASNYQTLLDFSNVQTATFGLGQKNDDGTFVSNAKSLTVTKTTVTENPVAFSTVITKGSKKIGYFLYTQFINTYDNDMRKVFADFKAQGVNELVLDLRLNGGGHVSSAETLSSLIAKNLTTSNVFLTYQYNDTYNTYFTKTYGASYLKEYFKSEANNLNLDRVFVLVSSGSASASELVINGLRPFMNIVLIGSETYGKNEFSYSVTDDKKVYDWGLQPLVGRSVNSLGQSGYGVTKDASGTWIYQGGFKPDYAVTDNVVPFKPFADESETLFSKALEVITGTTTARLSARESATVEAVTVGKKLQNFSDNPLKDRKEMFVDKFIRKP